jgi:hypothetical protein
MCLSATMLPSFRSRIAPAPRVALTTAASIVALDRRPRSIARRSDWYPVPSRPAGQTTSGTAESRPHRLFGLDD